MVIGSKISNILNQRWRLIVATLLGCALIFTLVASIRFGWTWTGFNKSLWDWMQLLIIPVALAVVAIWFNRVERRNEQAIASDNQQEAALQAYLDKMSDLLLKEGLRQSETNAEARIIARARTLTVLHKLDGKRKGSLLQFLYESGLIDKDNCVIDLGGADLRGVDLRGIKLRNTNLAKVDLGGADLSMADLSSAFLEEANLSGANLSGAILVDAFLICADLMEADLREANLEEADLGQIDLSKTFQLKAKLNLGDSDSKKLVYFGDERYRPYLYGADLAAVKFHKANLKKVYMWRADLHEANLRGANLQGAIITQEQLAQLKSNGNTTS